MLELRSVLVHLLLAANDMTWHRYVLYGVLSVYYIVTVEWNLCSAVYFWLTNLLCY